MKVVSPGSRPDEGTGAAKGLGVDIPLRTVRTENVRQFVNKLFLLLLSCDIKPAVGLEGSLLVWCRCVVRSSSYSPSDK